MTKRLPQICYQILSQTFSQIFVDMDLEFAFPGDSDTEQELPKIPQEAFEQMSPTLGR